MPRAIKRRWFLGAVLGGFPLPVAGIFRSNNHGNETLRLKIRRDFAEGNTIWRDGWLLSRTEAAFYDVTARS